MHDNHDDMMPSLWTLLDIEAFRSCSWVQLPRQHWRNPFANFPIGTGFRQNRFAGLTADLLMYTGFDILALSAFCLPHVVARDIWWLLTPSALLYRADPSL